MRAVLITLLAIVLPLQMAWARVSDACLHHTASHVHAQVDAHDHDHGPSAEALEPAAGDEPPSATDCHHACHHFTAVVSAPVLLTQGPLPDLVTAPPPPWAADQAAPRPDRPQWHALA
jgi:hypothetical protein